MKQDFTVYPAIDLRQGRVVRLQYGDPRRQTVFDDDPVAVAARWVEAGATWLHVINLDGAFGEASSANWELLPRLAACGARLQFGGGLRSAADVDRALALGVDRVILGTVAVEQPDLVAAALAAHGAAHVAVALDARDGIVRTRGWEKSSEIAATELGRQMRALGITTVIHTDIARDGVLSGVNAQASAALAATTGLAVIASGGVASLADVERVAAFAPAGVSGVITGRALYEGKLDLQAALMVSGRLT